MNLNAVSKWITAVQRERDALAEKLLAVREIIPKADIENAIECATDGKWVHFSFDIAEARELLTLLDGEG